ncbi:MAG TPA: hypothetical protein VGI16_13795 [Candidatus Acidoferrum sp.]|jgi:type II secretory pathway pseudopilin PulG
MTAATFCPQPGRRRAKRFGAAQRTARELGFTMVELLVATVVLMIGIVAVAQLVPASIVSNSANRYDSSALVVAQRELNEMVDQPLNGAAVLTDPVACPAGNTCLLGDVTQPNVVVGNPVLVVNNQAAIDFTGAAVPNYSFTYQDPNDPVGVTYDIRWAVITTVNPANPSVVTGRRFIVGTVKRGGNGFFRAVTLDTMVAK